MSGRERMFETASPAGGSGWLARFNDILLNLIGIFVRYTVRPPVETISSPTPSPSPSEDLIKIPICVAGELTRPWNIRLPN